VTRDSFGALVCNTALLLLLVYVYDLLNAFHWVSRAWIRQVIGGVVSDAICALVISFMCYECGAFNCGRTPSLVGA